MSTFAARPVSDDSWMPILASEEESPMRDECWSQAITEAEFVRQAIDQHSLDMLATIAVPLWASAG